MRLMDTNLIAPAPTNFYGGRIAAAPMSMIYGVEVPKGSIQFVDELIYPYSKLNENYVNDWLDDIQALAA